MPDLQALRPLNPMAERVLWLRTIKDGAPQYGQA
jgi:hypothetical protein